MIALACSKPPKGRERWTLRLLANKVVELGIGERATDLTIGRALKKKVSSRIAGSAGVIPPEANTGFVAAMEDVLDVYMRPQDPDRPLVCLDESSKQLIGEGRGPSQPTQPGQPARYDAEYERAGVQQICSWPSRRWTAGGRTQVTEHRTRHRLGGRSCERIGEYDIYPTAERIVVVLDNLNTHGPASFYEAYPPAEARRLVERFDPHYTPKHGSWLNMAEIELSVLARQLPRSADSRQTNPQGRNRRLGTRPQCPSHQVRLAIHNQRRPCQTQAPIPFNLDRGQRLIGVCMSDSCSL